MYHKELKTGTHTDNRTPMLTAALFTITKWWKQPKCPSTDEQINKMWLYTQYYSVIKRNEILEESYKHNR